MVNTPTNSIHPVLHTPLNGPWEAPHEIIYVAMGCFWGAERIMWNLPVICTAVGYMGGTATNPTYEDVCTGTTGHAETVRVVYDPHAIGVEEIIKTFFENHDPTQGDRQGNDIGSQYRSGVFYTTNHQRDVATSMRDAFQKVVADAPITTVIEDARQLTFYLAEDYHQAYLHHRPWGYCNHGPSGLTCPMPPTATGAPASN